MERGVFNALEKCVFDAKLSAFKGPRESTSLAGCPVVMQPSRSLGLNRRPAAAYKPKTVHVKHGHDRRVL